MFMLSCCESRSESRRDDRKTTPGTRDVWGEHDFRQRDEQTLEMKEKKFYRTELSDSRDPHWSDSCSVMKSGFRWIGFCWIRSFQRKNSTNNTTCCSCWNITNLKHGKYDYSLRCKLREKEKSTLSLSLFRFVRKNGEKKRHEEQLLSLFSQ